MAIRPIYLPSKDTLGITMENIDFEWFPGFSKQQKQKTYNSLHEAAKKELGIKKILEISTSSEEELGRSLSAFNLFLTTKNKKKITIETAFQGSKVFENGGPYNDLYGENSLGAKKDERLKSSGSLIGFKFFKEEYPLEPQTFFYDWIYINTLHQHEKYRTDVLKYEGFTDIEFNPSKSINNQAQSVALYVSLSANGVIEQALRSRDMFLSILRNIYEKKPRIPIQRKLL